jgi:hypothetical protein
MVVPITEPQDQKLRLARWLPPGRYVDIFSGAVYEGDREIWLSRTLEIGPLYSKKLFKLRFLAITESKEIRTFINGVERKSLIASESNGSVVDLGSIQGKSLWNSV